MTGSVSHVAAVAALLAAGLGPGSAGAEDAASGPAGLWLTQDRGGVIAVSHCGAHLCARIVGIVLDSPTEPTPRDVTGRSQCDLPLFSDAAPTGPDLWRGHIRDPRNGSIWDMQIWLNPNGTLSMRGFLGVSLLGRTETWTRYPGPVPADCRLSPADVRAAAGPR